jgi:release factor glutamine methyltransferase
MVARRIRREPLAYILGRREFYSLEFVVTPAVLIPRPETETVVSTALELIRDHADARICDVGTGSGAIALAITANAPGAHVTATDVSPEALAIARCNAVRFEIAARVQFRLADCFEPIDKMEPLGRFDFVVSNPPYIKEDEVGGLAPEISNNEPRLALAGGQDGLDFYRRLAATLPDHLKKRGSAIVEIGAGQAVAVTQILHTAGATNIRLVPDLADLPRVVVAAF